jgi:glycosyltransferase involved in cell wall biosynthesis
MKILLVQDTDWLARNIHQQHHVLERLCLRGHAISVIDYELNWQTEGKRELFSRRQVFRGVSKVVNDADITVTRPGILKVPLLDYASMLLTYNREISAQLRESRPDVIVGMYILTSYLALRLAKKNGIPFIVQVLEPHYQLIPYEALRPIGKMIEGRILREADHVVVINEGLREYAMCMGAHADNISVIRAGIDLEKYGSHVDGLSVRRRYGIEAHETVLLFMGWLYHFSGLKEMLAALAKCTRDDVKVKLLIVGDGDAFEELQRMRADLHLETSVILPGKQPYDKIPEFVAAADVCLLPAYNNAIMRDIVPIKMYEYMAMGKPVIATRLRGLVKEFGDDNGVLYVDRPEDALPKALELIATNAIKAHGEQARQFVQNNDWGNVVEAFENVLLECVQSNGR